VSRAPVAVLVNTLVRLLVPLLEFSHIGESSNVASLQQLALDPPDGSGTNDRSTQLRRES
jgi:hypothetical protein